MGKFSLYILDLNVALYYIILLTNPNYAKTLQVLLDNNNTKQKNKNCK